jgi:hypothetical protein
MEGFSELPQELKSAISALAVVIFSWLTLKLKERIDEKRKKEKGFFEPVLNGARILQSYLDESCKNVGADISFLVRCENGGEIAKVDSILNSNAFVQSEHETNFLEVWKQRRIDNFHRTELIYILRDDFDSFDLNHAKGSIKDFMTTYGFKEGVIFFIRENEKVLTYGFMFWKEDSRIDDKQRESLRKLKGQLLATIS